MNPAESIPVLSLEALAIGYEGYGPLLTGINLQLQPGELVALIGRNGSGKSTLIRSLVGLLPVTAGECFLDGRQVRSMDLRRRARKVSYVSAGTGPVPPMTLRELVSLGRMPYTGWRGKLRKNDLERVEMAIAAVQLQGLADRAMDQLSDGERQRAMIARAFAQDAPLMVLDEPTAFLDLAHKYELIQLLADLRREGRTILYSTHDLESALMFTDRLWVISGSEVREGAPEDLGLEGIFDALFESSGITFDVGSRRFRRTAGKRGALRLTGEDDLALAWTRNAMERLGFEIRPDAEWELRLESEGGERQWIFIRGQGRERFGDIGSMARFLIKEN
jgi:iron complex transport system ATP-binding protein